METSICQNPWCKATFQFSEAEATEENGVRLPPRQCHKCVSFGSELSGGVTWTTKEYEGSRFDGTPHQIRYKVTNFR